MSQFMIIIIIIILNLIWLPLGEIGLVGDFAGDFGGDWLLLLLFPPYQSPHVRAEFSLDFVFDGVLFSWLSSIFNKS